MEKQINTYPVGDFLSGFSEDSKNPCEYELECQRMTIRGYEYLVKHPKLADQIKENGYTISAKELKPMIEYMCLNEENSEESFGQTGAMVSHTVQHSYIAFRQGWAKYIQALLNLKNDEQEK